MQLEGLGSYFTCRTSMVGFIAEQKIPNPGHISAFGLRHAALGGS